jgi:hypothetical protein
MALQATSRLRSPQVSARLPVLAEARHPQVLDLRPPAGGGRARRHECGITARVRSRVVRTMPPGRSVVKCPGALITTLSCAPLRATSPTASSINAPPSRVPQQRGNAEQGHAFAGDRRS